MRILALAVTIEFIKIFMKTTANLCGFDGGSVNFVPVHRTENRQGPVLRCTDMTFVQKPEMDQIEPVNKVRAA